MAEVLGGQLRAATGAFMGSEKSLKMLNTDYLEDQGTVKNSVCIFRTVWIFLDMTPCFGVNATTPFLFSVLQADNFGRSICSLRKNGSQFSLLRSFRRMADILFYIVHSKGCGQKTYKGNGKL